MECRFNESGLRGKLLSVGRRNVLAERQVATNEELMGRVRAGCHRELSTLMRPLCRIAIELDAAKHHRLFAIVGDRRVDRQLHAARDAAGQNDDTTGNRLRVLLT